MASDRGTTCEAYVTDDGAAQCGNCGCMWARAPLVGDECPHCGATVVALGDWSEADDAFWE